MNNTKLIKIKYINIMNNLNLKTKQILTGLLLGDAHLSRSGDKSLITVEQSIKHKDYVIFLHKLMKESGIDLYDIKYYSRVDKRYDKLNESIYFKSHNTYLLNFLSEIFLDKEGKKIIPYNIKDLLNPVTLAYWICDDGQLVKKGGITLCTDNYTHKEVDILREALNMKFYISCTIHNKKGKTGNIYKKIYIKKLDFSNIKPYIYEHVHPLFIYKLHKDT